MRTRFFRALLRLYPRSYRARYGAEMEAFHRQERELGERGPAFWARTLVDHIHAAAVVRWRDGDGMMRTLWGDLASGVRTLGRARLFTLFAVSTLGLGIGATTAVFSVVDRVLLRALPYPDSERMVLVGIRARHNPEGRGPLSAPLSRALIDAPGPAEAVVVAGSSPVVFQGAGDPERLTMTLVSEGFFDFFGARAAVGRLLTDDDQAPDADRTAVLGYGMWLSRYGGDPSVIGRTIRLNAEPHTIVGVLARTFIPPAEVVNDGLVWTPLRLGDGDRDRGSFSHVGVARLRPGETAEAMEARVGDVVTEAYPPGDGPNFLVGGAARDFRAEVVGPIAGTLGRVLGAVGLLLLIACVNVASLLLTRGTERTRELSIRTALGAGRARLIRQLLTENLVLALAGASLGCLLAFGAVDLFRRSAPPGLPRIAELAVDARAFGFAFGLSALTVLVFGLLPALRSVRRTGRVTIDSERTSPSVRDGRIRGGLVALETALAVVLAVGSGLLAKDLIRTATNDPGFVPAGLASMRVNLSPRYERAEWVAMWEQFVEGAAALPGAHAAAVATQVPYAGDRIMSTYRPEGLENAADADVQGEMIATVAVGGDYLSTLGVQLVEGRGFGPGDDDGNPTALVNEAFVRRFWPGESGVAKHVRSGGEGVDDEPDYQVVGVLRDVRSVPGRDVPATIYLPLQAQPWRDMEVMVRTEGDAVQMSAALRDLARTLDAELPVTSVRTVSSLGSEALARPRFYTILFAGFASIALVLAVVGVYGTTSYSTRSSTREIGIRMALGARRGRVVRGVVFRSTLAVGGGVVLGLVIAAMASRTMTDMLYQVSARDGASYGTVGIMVLAAGVVASWIPAEQAGRVDPAQTLRQDG